jgi:hypothetical protein
VTLDRWTEIYGFIAAAKIEHHRDEFRSDQVELRLGAASAVLNNFSLFIPNPQPDWGPKMSDRHHRRMVGIVGFAAGALLAAPLTSLLASPVASADDTDVVSLRPVHD